MQILFELDMNPRDLDTTLRTFWKGKATNRASKSFTHELVRGTIAHLQEIDELIQTYAQNWDLKRMGRVDRNVMRMAIYEMLYCKKIPPVVSIDEAVEIAKAFGSEGSGRFVNGILDGIRKKLDRPAREPLQEA